MSRQRTAVLAELSRGSAFRSAQEVHAELRSAAHRIGLTTVYRALARLAEAGEVDVSRNEAGEVTYRVCSVGHHHHLVCRHCGATVEVEGRAVESWTERVSRTHGFTDVEHTVEVVGTCARCSA